MILFPPLHQLPLQFHFQGPKEPPLQSFISSPRFDTLEILSHPSNDTAQWQHHKHRRKPPRRLSSLESISMAMLSLRHLLRLVRIPVPGGTRSQQNSFIRIPRISMVLRVFPFTSQQPSSKHLPVVGMSMTTHDRVTPPGHISNATWPRS